MCTRQEQVNGNISQQGTCILWEQVLPATSSMCSSQHRKQQLGFISQEMLCNLIVPWRTSFPPESDTPTLCKKEIKQIFNFVWIIAFRATDCVSKGCPLQSACLNRWEKQNWVGNFSARRMRCQCREICVLFALCDGREALDGAGREHGPQHQSGKPHGKASCCCHGHESGRAASRLSGVMVRETEEK